MEQRQVARVWMLIPQWDRLSGSVDAIDPEKGLLRLRLRKKASIVFNVRLLPRTVFTLEESDAVTADVAPGMAAVVLGKFLEGTLAAAWVRLSRGSTQEPPRPGLCLSPPSIVVRYLNTGEVAIRAVGTGGCWHLLENEGRLVELWSDPAEVCRLFSTPGVEDPGGEAE